MADDNIIPLDFSNDGVVQTFSIKRSFACSRKALWDHLTQTEYLEAWLAPGSIEATEGGRARLNFRDSGTVIDSAVTFYAPLAAIAFSWSRPGEPDRPVRWDLADGAGLAQLTVTLGAPATEDGGKLFAGWVAHLEMLSAALAGAPMAFPFDKFKAGRETFKAYGTT